MGLIALHYGIWEPGRPMNDVTGPEMKIRKAKEEYTPLGFYLYRCGLGNY